MKEFKGTPGPWDVHMKGGTCVIDPSGKVVTCFVSNCETDPSADVADALLAAASHDLLEAALFAERRSKQPGEGNTEFFERLADEFYERHGYLAPGKDDPLRSVSIEEAQEEWGRFLNEPGEARRAAIAKALGDPQ